MEKENFCVIKVIPVDESDLIRDGKSGQVYAIGVDWEFRDGSLDYIEDDYTPDWLTDLINECCPNNEEEDLEKSLYWIPDDEIEALKSEASFYAEEKLKAKKFIIFRQILDDDTETELPYSRLRLKDGSESKLTYGVFCSVQDESRCDWDDTFSVDDRVPDWLHKVLAKVCPNHVSGPEEPDLWIPEDEFNELKKLAYKYIEVDSDGNVIRDDQDIENSKIWIDLTDIRKFMSIDSRVNPATGKFDNEFWKKINPIQLETEEKTYEWFYELWFSQNCNLSLYRETGTENYYLCIEPPDDYKITENIKKRKVNVTGKTLEKVKLRGLAGLPVSPTFHLPVQELLDAREKYLKLLNWFEDWEDGVY